MIMELKSPSMKSGGVTPLDCPSDPEEKEMSDDDDDDDRNHKHRRRETMSQSLERDPLEQSFTQPYRKRNRPFENGQSDSQSQYGVDRGFSKFEKRCPVGVNFSRFPGEHGSGRGRGRDYQRDSRFGSFDIASQMPFAGSIPSAMLLGRGLPNLSNPQNSSWGGFGLLPAIPNGAIDTINPLGLPGLLRPQLNPSLNMGIQCQRCRDFEERGFCMRGDMCPMEHGVNRIVVEDVQSLSQFNLPVSLSSAHLLGTSPGSGFGPSLSVSSGTLINSRGLHSRTSNCAVDNDALNLDVTFHGTANASQADVYDPDEPLWNTDGHESSRPLIGLQPANRDDSESLMETDLSDRLVQSGGVAIGLQSTNSSVWGRLNSSNHKLELKEKFDSGTKPSEYLESRPKEMSEASGCSQGTSYLGKQNNGAAFGPKTAGSTPKLQNNIECNVRKSSQKAQRTLFVNCIPLKDNKKENLLSHFRKFGQVIDIYIPANSQRAFVQFSKREEAERALKAPDAVLGSRFIKLWWANRDSIAGEGMSSVNAASRTPHDVSAASGSPHTAVGSEGKGDLQCAASKVAVPRTPDSLVTSGNDFKPVTANRPKAPPPVQKKMENLEHLKEELRKKQEMLEQKRNEFRQQLEKLAKQATGAKSQVPAGNAAKRQKVETSTHAGKCGNIESADAVISESSSRAELLVDKMVNVERITSQRSKTNSADVLQDSPSMKQTICPVATSGAHFHMNRYKLDNRPTTFRINAPLPATLTNVAALRDHFSLYGAISNVEIEELGEECHPNALNGPEVMRDCSARVSFATRHSAARAFSNGKSWHGQNLQFTWLTSGIPSSSRSSGESSSAPRGALNTEVQSAEKTTPQTSRDAFGAQESDSSPRKSSNELSCESSRSGDKANSPVAVEENSIFEAQSPEKSANYIPLEVDEAENRDTEVQEEESDLRAGPMLLARE